jgi:CRP/FNR family cyclic AMP-dependent transcriptional regulator
MNERMDISLQMDLVKKQPLFFQLTESETEELAALFSEKIVEAGEVIVKEGEPVDCIYLIASGTADVRHIEMQNDVAVASSLAILSFGDAIGLNETGLYSLSGKRTASVVALTAMILYRLNVTAFNGFVLAHSHVSDIMHQKRESSLGNEEM